jgi:hypothetical protein
MFGIWFGFSIFTKQDIIKIDHVKFPNRTASLKSDSYYEPDTVVSRLEIKKFFEVKHASFLSKMYF